MVRHLSIRIVLTIIAVFFMINQVNAQIPGLYSGDGPLVDYFSVPPGSGLLFGVGSWGGYSAFGPWGLYDQYGLFGPFGLFGPSGPGYGSCLGFGGFGMHAPPGPPPKENRLGTG